MDPIYDKEKDHDTSLYNPSNSDGDTLTKEQLDSAEGTSSGSNSGAGGNYSFGGGNSGGTGGSSSNTKEDDKTSTESGTSSNTKSGNNIPFKNQKVSTKGGSTKKKLMIGGAGAGAAAIFLVLFIFLSSLLIPDLAQNILTYQFARVNRTFSQKDTEITAEKDALDTVEDESVGNSLADTYKNLSDGMWDKINTLTPSGVLKKMETDGVIKYNYGPSGFFNKRTLKSVTINGEDIDVSQVTDASKFSKVFHPIENFQNKVNLASAFSSSLDEAMRGNTGVVLRLGVENNIRNLLDVPLYAWATGKYKGTTPEEADVLEARDSQAEIDPGSETTPSLDAEVSQAETAGENTLNSDLSTEAGAEAIIQHGGVDPNVNSAIASVLKADALKDTLNIVNPIYGVAVPVCIIYDGSLQSPNAGQTIDNHDSEDQRSFFRIESANDQQRAGATNAEAVGAMNRQLNGAADSNPIQRASGQVINTNDDSVSPQASSIGTYSIADAVIPGVPADVINQIATLCPVLTNLGVGVGLTAVNVAAWVFSDGSEEEAALAAEEGVDGLMDGVAAKIASQFTDNITANKIGIVSKKLSEMVSLKSLGVAGAITALTLVARLDTFSKMNETDNGLSQGTDLANQADAGGNANAQQLEQQEYYGVPLANDQVNYNKTADAKYIAQANSTKSAYQRYLAIANANSLVSRLGLGLMADMSRSFVSSIFSDAVKIFNPVSIGSSILRLFDSKVAAAPSSTSDTTDYGIVQWGYTSQEDALTNGGQYAASYQPLENQKILDDSGMESYIQSTYGACFTDSMGTLLTTAPTSGPDTGDKAYIVRDNDGNVTGGLCTENYLGPNSKDGQAADGQYGNDLIFRWRLAQSYDNTLTQLTSIQNDTPS